VKSLLPQATFIERSYQL